MENFAFDDFKYRRKTTFCYTNKFKNAQILIFGCFGKLNFIHGSIVELYKQERGNFDAIKDI